MNEGPDYIRFRIPVERNRFGDLRYEEAFASTAMLPYLWEHVRRIASGGVRRMVERPIIWDTTVSHRGPSSAELEAYTRYLKRDAVEDALRDGLSVISISPVHIEVPQGYPPGHAQAFMHYLGAPMSEWKENG